MIINIFSLIKAMTISALSLVSFKKPSYLISNKLVAAGFIMLMMVLPATSFAAADTVSAQEHDQTTRKDLTSAKPSALQERSDKEQQIYKNPFGIAFYKPTYVLPFYYTQTPYQQIYDSNTPDNQRIMNEEFKAQLSLQFQIWRNMFNSHTSLKAAYTQLSYWQVYAKSQFFRETNYEPEVFLENNTFNNWFFDLGVVHQSNGRGGNLERSWNRLYTDIRFSDQNWLVSLKPWLLIFKSESSDIHNPDIAKYLGYGRLLVSYKFRQVEFSLKLRNIFQSGFKRGAEELDVSFPLFGRVKGYVQLFSGYGQSLIEYNHYTNAAGVGIALNDWL